jgi:hypothetical protein
MGTVQIDGSTPKLTIGNATAEDATILFDGNAKDFYISLDDSADKLVIGEGSTVGTNSILTITDDSVTVGDASAVDTKIVFDGNAQDYYVGLDDSSDSLVLGLGSTLGTTPAITINSSQVATFAQNPVFPDGSLALADLDIDGGTDIGAAIVDADLFIIDDGAGGTNRKTVASRLKTYIGNSGGITAASQWRLTTAFTGGASPIASNLEETDTYGAGVLGSSMTESSGIFTFPSTGFWFITWTTSFKYDGDSAYAGHQMAVTTDNSSYNTAINNYAHIGRTSTTTTYANITSTYILDVTNVSNDKVKFIIAVANSSVTTEGDTGANTTHMSFIRLGDT